MRDLEREARRYLTPPAGAFWHWSDEGTVVVLNNGCTVAFDAELLAIMRRLAPRGLPPMSSVVLLLSAIRGAWHSQIELISPSELFGTYGHIVEQTARLMAGLDRVALLDAELLAPLPAKVAVAELVFQITPPKTDTVLARAVVELLENGVGEDRPIGQFDDEDLNATVELFNARELLAMLPGLESVTAERLELRMRTGLDELVEPADLDEPLPERVRTLLARLTRDEQHAGLAGLARNLMAAVTLPRPVSDPEEMPLGGVSDIANRGPLDRLLLSELAHDDLTLAVRVAVGEALYLRRESPPKTPPRQRTLLLDVGLRMWGLPRVFATAVALALAATADSRAEFVIRRAHGKSIEPVDLSTRAGLEEHLTALSTELHPGEALEAFCHELPPESAEPLIVTTEEALDDPQLLSELRRQPLAPLFLATVSRTGEFSLYQDMGRGRKLLRQAQLDLEQVLRSPKPRVLDRRRAKDLPAIFSVDPFPLLLPYQIDPQSAWAVESHGVLALTKDRRLLHFNAKGRGGRQLSDRMPRGGLHWFTPRAANLNAYAVIGNLQTARLHLLEILLDRGHCEVLPLELPQTQPATAVCAHNGALFVVFQKTIAVLEMATGRHLQSIALPRDMRWLHGRLLSADWGTAYFCISYDGIEARLEAALGAHAALCPKLLTMFERSDLDGPIGVTTRGDLFFTATGETREVEHGLIGPLEAHVSADGRRVVLGHEKRPPFTGTKRIVVDVDTMSTRTYINLNPLQLAEPALNLETPPTLRNRFFEIIVSPSAELTLRSRNQRLAIVYEPSTDRICLKVSNDYTPSGNARSSFEPLQHNDRGYRLQEARFPDGSRAVLDSRGLLHLASSDKSIPEVTLVLQENGISGWCSDGRMWGREYFLGGVRGANKHDVFQSTIKRFIERLT